MNDRDYYKRKYRRRYKPTPIRAFVKMVVFRVISSGLTAGVVYGLTGSMSASKWIFLIDLTLKSVLYYFYEFQWAKALKWWDKRKKPSVPS